jgi:hypothetical protein
MNKQQLKYVEKFYTVKENGDIFKKSNGNKMSISTCKIGYKRVWLTVNGKRMVQSVHRLVAVKYVKGRCRYRCDVNHLDGDKNNNHFSNLQWVTKKENTRHAIDVLGRNIGGRYDRGSSLSCRK